MAPRPQHDSHPTLDDSSRAQGAALSLGVDGSAATEADIAAVPGEERDPKTGKRLMLGPAKKGLASARSGDATSPPPFQAMVTDNPAQAGPVSPRSPYHSANMAASPGLLRSHSPRLHSPADSEIFERNVQEPVSMTVMPTDGPAHIPTHVMTEDYIPPALEASAQAITSEDLDPDEVEIVTAAAHQSAAASMLESSTSFGDSSQTQSPLGRHDRSDESEPTSLQHSGIIPQPPADVDDGASSYGQLNPNDVRRLSFISFADVVQSEHQSFGAESQTSQTSLNSIAQPTPISAALHERNTSPLRSPRSLGSARGVATPPLPGVSVTRVEQSPARSTGIGGGGIGTHGELTIETMRQAVRKTASGDLSGVRSAGMSPTSDEASYAALRSRTDT